MTVFGGTRVKRRHDWKTTGGRAVVPRKAVASVGRASDRDNAFLLKPLSARARRVVNALGDEALTAAQISEATGIPNRAVKSDLYTLSRRGIASKSGSRWAKL